MSETKVTSRQFTLDLFDLSKSAIVFFITALLTAVLASIEAGEFPGWKDLLLTVKVAGVSAIGYLIKQFLTKQILIKPVE